MKTELKKLGKEIRELRSEYKSTQREGKYPSSYILITKQEVFRFKHVVYTLNKKKVAIEDISTEKILELGIEKRPVNPNKAYRELSIHNIKVTIEKMREVKEDSS